MRGEIKLLVDRVTYIQNTHTCEYLAGNGAFSTPMQVLHGDAAATCSTTCPTPAQNVYDMHQYT